MFNLTMAPILFNRDFVLAKRQGQKTETFMCYLSGNAANILKTSKSDDNGKISSLTTRYTDDAKCKRNNKIKLEGNRHFECRPIKNEIMEKNLGSDWTTKKITVGCKVVIP